jgi:hypothetical protein
MAPVERSAPLALFLLVSISGCAAPRVAATEPTPPPPIAVQRYTQPSAAILALPEQPVRIVIEGRPSIVIGPSGVLLVELRVLGRWSAGGAFEDASGEIFGRITDDGLLRLERGGAQFLMPVVLDADGAATIDVDGPPPLRLRIDERDHIIGAGREVRIEGLTRATRRIAMLAFLSPDLLALIEPSRVTLGSDGHSGVR